MQMEMKLWASGATIFQIKEVKAAARSQESVEA